MFDWLRRRRPSVSATPVTPDAPVTPTPPLGLIPNGRYITRIRGQVQKVIFIRQIGGEALVETAGGIRYYVAPGALSPVRGHR